MLTAEVGLFAITAYTVAFVGQVAYSKQIVWRAFLLFASLIAIALHAVQLHQLIDLPMGQNLSWVNLLSLLTWLSILLIFLVDFILPVASLNFLVYPAAIMAIGLSEFFHPTNILVTQYHPRMLLHILLATLIMALLMICAIQALMLVLQQFALKRKKMLSLLQLLPPLQIMERLLFFEIGLSFIGLSLFLFLTASSVDFNLLASSWRETLLSLALWAIFLMLLIGRYSLKWRTATAAVWASLGVGIALLMFLTSHLR